MVANLATVLIKHTNKVSIGMKKTDDVTID